MDNNYQMQVENNVKKKPKYWVIILVILLVVASGVLGWYLGTKNNSESTKNDTKAQVNKEESKTEKNEVENISFDKTNANMQLSNLWYGLEELNLTTDGSLIPQESRNSQDLLSDQVKIKLGYYYIYKNCTDQSKLHYGEEGTGLIGIDYDYFKQEYEKIYGESLPSNADYSLLRYKEAGYESPIKDNILYSVSSTGIDRNSILKANSITKTNDTYELVIDVLYSKDSSVIDTYVDESNVTYPEDLVAYKIKITYEINDNNNYIIKNMIAY